MSAYRGERGRRYFEWQRQIGEAGARLNRWKFLPHVSDDAVVLDFGCGSGALLAGLPAARRIGVEVSEQARAVAAKGGIETHASLRDVPGDSVDVAISNHALEHTLDPHGELCELRRVLRPDGKLVLWVPCDDWRNESASRTDRNHHLHTWTPLLLRNLLAEAGFDVEHCRLVTHAWPPAYERLESILPRRAFDALSYVTAVVRRRRQVMAVARPRPEPA
jgi:SAM-dependent methyltransferase